MAAPARGSAPVNGARAATIRHSPMPALTNASCPAPNSPVVDGVAHHLAGLQRSHLGAAVADQILLAEIHAVVDVVVVVRVADHGLHGVASLLDELERRRLTRC